MRFLAAAIAVLVLAVLGLFLLGARSAMVAHGELRCEGAGGIIINVDGKDYAVNGVAGPRYPPIESIWNSATHPEVDLTRIISRGLTLVSRQGSIAASEGICGPDGLEYRGVIVAPICTGIS